MFRAEAIKKKLAPTATTQPRQHPAPSNKPINSAGIPVPPLGFGAFNSDDEDQGSRPQVQKINRGRAPNQASGPISVGTGAYTKEEIEVLRYQLFF